ncbi:MAG TPA: PKD domain-containing protein, partial [Bacteroidia bacterium]|nr:PKD domain-containing protein [Bacteroidia bacterium]
NGLFVFRVPFAFPHPITAAITTAPATCSYALNGMATVNPSGGTAPYTYQWSSGHSSQTVTTLLPGNYTVTISDRYGYNIVETVTVTGPSPISVNVQVGAESCEGTADGAIDLHTSGGTPGYSFLWSTGDMVEDLNSLTAGTYWFTITDSAGCIYQDTVSVSFLLPAPPAFAGRDTTICSRSLLLNASLPSLGVGHWEWISGNGTLQNPNLPSTWASNLQQGSNLLAWVVFNGQCSGVDTLQVQVSSAAFIDAGNDTVVCTSNLQLAASAATNAQGAWSALPNTVAFSNISNPDAIASGLQPGQYQLFWSVSDAHCQASDSITVWVSRLPFAAFSFTPTVLTVGFQNLSQFATSWFWSFGDGNTSTLQNPVHVYAQPGVYNVCLIATDTCGRDTSCQAVGLTLIDQALPLQPKVEVWPNPFGNWIGLSVEGATAESLDCKLIDLQGRSLWQSTLELQQTQGEFRLALPDLAAGVYFLEIRTASWSKVVQLMRGN